MYFYEVVPAKIFRANSDILTYSSTQPLTIGTIVIIPLGKKTVPGLVVKKVQQPAFPTKPIEKPLYDTPLPSHLLKSLFWLSEYYFSPLPTVLQSALPRGIEKTRRQKPSAEKMKKPSSSSFPLSLAQQKAIDEIQNSSKNTTLLHGITGSGKTNIYLELTRQTLKKNQSVILLVPEIALTSQLIQKFQSHFENITLLHSKQTESERHLSWAKILTSQESQVIIGPRSALFAPVSNLGLIIIDEAHEPAYSQDQSPKYSAIRLASTMSKVVLGTATPLVSDYYLAASQGALVTLDELAVKSNKTAETHIIDLKNRGDFKKHRLISDPLIKSIQSSLDNKTQSMIFHNRRGSAPLTVCNHCGWQALCPNCLLPLNLHTDKFLLICHTCGRKSKVATSCPDCKNSNIIHKGFGTKYLESELKKLFPTAKIARFDADTEIEKSLQNSYDQIKNGHIDIIIGTQMLAKGFDFPLLSTLGVVQADAGLSLPDFSSEERTFQLLTQVIGRANRGHQDSKIFIQTYQPHHSAIKFGITANYADFFSHCILTRQKATLPPYSFILKLTLSYKTESIVVKNTQTLYEFIKKYQNTHSDLKLSVSAPTPSFHEHTPNGYTWQLILKSKKRSTLIKILRAIPSNPQLRFHLDPLSLL